MIAGITQKRLIAFTRTETRRYLASRPNTQAALKAGADAYLAGVPMHWMRDWPMPFPLLVASAKGARITDVDGYGLDDFCLGDTGSLFGHSPGPVAKAITRQAKRGLTYMLPSADALEAGRLLTKRFGEYRWQIASTASDANRCAIRVARAVTGRPKILVFNGCYHGTVDDVMVTLKDGRTVPRSGLVGQVANPAEHAVVVEFNDLPTLQAALAKGDVAAILAEPVMTNCAMVLPDPGFWDGVRAACDATASLLIMDETHTISSGLGGWARNNGLRADILVIGKSVAGGIACAVWGLSHDLAKRFLAHDAKRPPGHSGMGTTLSGNPMQFAALRANLSKVMTKANYVRMERNAARLEAGLAAAITGVSAPWHVARVGARVEFICAPGPLHNGVAAMAAHEPQVERAVHLGLVNRGCLIAPFHNMMLVSPSTKRRQVDRLIGAFVEVLAELFD
ncbi:aspartate aminotransferase family protein [Pseudorhodobacter sp.]|uniref:aspartate aminotransferase family protein n=1 Tax=Pseudorhodobacter sp. TaxID=1934400 RepID=UPI0026475C35|nr:aspartate aminotransferase family protein [Pseudorhodobacter sp.]MDN5787065.1 aspartate aminotransferase family protein [Pseudorhodobacter sp.]